MGFLTVFPVAPGGVAQMGPARAHFPLVGLVLGGILAGLDFAAGEALPASVVGALLVMALLVLTRAIRANAIASTKVGAGLAYQAAARGLEGRCFCSR